MTSVGATWVVCWCTTQICPGRLPACEVRLRNRGGVTFQRGKDEKNSTPCSFCFGAARTADGTGNLRLKIDACPLLIRANPEAAFAARSSFHETALQAA